MSVNGTRHSVPNEPPGWAQVLVFGSLCPVGIQLQAQEDLTVQEKKGVERLLLNTRVPGFVGGFFIAKVMRAWAQFLFPAAVLPG